MKHKRIMAILIAVFMLVASTTPALAVSEGLFDNEIKTIQLKGFSYSMDGRQIDKMDDLTMDISYKLGNDPWLALAGINKLDTLRKGNTEERIPLSEIGTNNYYGNIKVKDAVVGSVYLEMVNGNPIHGKRMKYT